MVYYNHITKLVCLLSIFCFASILVISIIGSYGLAYGQGNTEFTATLSGKEVVPSVNTGGTGIANFEVNWTTLIFFAGLFIVVGILEWLFKLHQVIPYCKQ